MQKKNGQQFWYLNNRVTLFLKLKEEQKTGRK